MGALIREKNCSQTPLGGVDAWPQSLRSAVSICLGSGFPIAIYWGPQLALLYNDAWSPILGAKHPWALCLPAREVWPEIWDTIGPLFQHVTTTGEATRSKDQLLAMHRHGYTEECYFDYTFSPIRGESGQVEGIFNAVLETTERVVGERRSRTVRELAGQVAEARTAEFACRSTAQTLAQASADIPFALLYLVSDDGREAFLKSSVGLDAGTPESPLRISITGPDDTPVKWPVAQVVRTGEAQAVATVDAGFRPLPGGPWPEPSNSALVLPLARAGSEQPYGALVAGVSPRRALDAEYRGFLDTVANHISQAFANAEAYEEERERAEALAEIDRAKTAFFSNVSHEFRTPLTLMLGPLEEMLAMDRDLPPAVREMVSVTHRNGLRLQKLVNSLLDFSRIEAGRVQASYEPTDLAALTAELASTFRSAAEKAGLQLIVDCPPLPGPVYVDRDMWEKVVLNLLSNALKYTFEGSITVRLSAQGDFATLSVSDTGTGIPEHELPHLFERFHRVEGARGRTQEGTGIGLALVAELVKLHAGTVQASSQLGQGTTFTVSLRFGTGHLPSERLSAARTGGTPNLSSSALHADSYIQEAIRWLPDRPGVGVAPRGPSSTRVLVADDNADMRDYVTRLLRSEYEVESVASGTEALAAILDHPPDLVLSDVMMPGLDGFALLKALRGNPETSALPVILLSARAGEEARVSGLDAGATDYLVKPFTARELLARVGAHVEMARLRKLAAAREAELRREAEAARDEVVGVLQSITDAFAVFDREWRFTYVNPEAERLLRMPREELLGKVHWEVFPETLGTIVEQEYRRATRDQVSIEFEYYHEPRQRWFVIRGYPTLEGGLSNYFRDITEQKRAEAALREQDALREADRRKWRELFFQVPAAVTLLRGPHHSFEYFNDEFRRMVGRSAEQLSGKPLREVLPEVIPQSYFQLLDSVYQTGLLQNATEALLQVDVHGDGVLQDVYVNVVCLPTRDDGGRVDGVLAHAVDVTDLVRSRKRIEESEERFRQLAESMPQVVWTSTADGVCDYVNSRWTELTGLDLAGTQAGAFRSSMLPEDLDTMDRALSEGLRTGQPYSFECRFRSVADGSLRWHLVRTVPVKNGSGQVIKWLGTSTDLDEQKRAAEALRLSEWRLRLTLDAAALGSWELDLGTQKAKRSPRHDAIFGHETPLDSWTFSQFLEHVLPQDREDVERRFQNSLSDGGEWSFECRIRRVSDGAIRWIWGYGKTVPDAFGMPSLMLGLVSDITERKEAETALAQANDDLRRANADLEQFGYSASHDLQEPLRAVTIYSELLSKRYGEKLDGQALEILGFLRSGASRMQMLVRDLLAYTQVRNVEEPEESAAMQILADTLENLENAIGESSAQITHGALPAVKVHKVHLQQLLQNLIGNALKYRSERPPLIHVAAEKRSGQWLFSVQDNGIGIDAEYKERIFGLFKRLHSGDEYSGTGIGLAICKRIVERYGGRIWVESIPGEGSTFYFTLPL